MVQVILKYVRNILIFVLKSFVSSAKMLAYDSMTKGKPLMYNKYNNGPNTLRWGILFDILAHSDFA